jgi:hypothetical protein
MFSLFLGFVMCFVIAWMAFPWAWHSFKIREYMIGGIETPVYVGKAFLVIGIFLFGIRYLVDFIRQVVSVLKLK